MDFKAALDKKNQELNTINLKLQELDNDRLRLREEGLFLMGAIDILSTQVKLDEYDKEKAEQQELPN